MATADAPHLERMGRELKCPICLSLFNKAVSLTCNHVFCNCCIQESMKSATYCPVCKVPFRRREIRPAPHMDNLVNIYKSMEVAWGVNMFVTQTAPPMRTSGIENDPDDDRICELQDSQKTCTGTSSPEKPKTNETKGLGKSVQIPVKPSFPAKKRVHVPQCPPSEMRSTKITNETPTITNSKLWSPNMLNDKPVLDKKGEPLFTPFFWLREDEDSQKTTQQTYDNQISGTPPDVPSFSDIKDTDDEVPGDMPPELGTCTADCEKDFFDSEMFEWTQRACSPELCSSPVHQAENGTECVRQQANRFASRTETVIMESIANKRGIMNNATNKADTNQPSSSSPKNVTVNKTAGMSGKRTKKAVEKRQSKRAKNTIDASGAHKKLENLPEKNIQKLGKSGDELNVIKKSSKYKNNVGIDADVTRTTGNLSGSSSGETILIQDNSKLVVDLPDLSVHKKYEKISNSKDIGKISGNVSPVDKSSFDSKARKLKATKKSITIDQSEVLIAHLPEKLSCDEVEGFDKGRILKRCKANHNKRKPNLKMVRFLEDNNTDCHNIKGKVASKDVEKFGADQVTSNEEDMGTSSGMEAFCDKICCAFCQSAEVSEVSGVMLHYLKGKSVAGDHIEGPNVVHCHKNCTEWAPNVFFEDDNAINLEAELRRSQKIKCRLCGNRGAALGCFERSCRKSFHVPCAKMTPLFRWDYENFVVLCPLHASGELPFEAPTIQSKQKISAPKRDSHMDKTQAGKDHSKENLPWKSHRNTKDFILCCSGLNNIEKEVVSEFEKLSRITVLKNWDPSVTHVVASTNDNGACKRTLKFLMGVLEGKWIVNIEWVRSCMKSMRLVDEEPHEIRIDTHGIKDGPKLGRLRYLQKKPKLFNGYKFYFMGNFLPSYKGYLHDLVTAAGGSVLKRKPVPKDEDIFASNSSTVFIVYNVEEEKSGTSKRSSTLQQRCLDAEALAVSSGAVAVTNTWVLNSIAGCKLQKLPL